MSATILDTTAPGWEVALVGGSWCHVNHVLKLATSGWGSPEAAARNANGYRGDATALKIVAARYAEHFEGQTGALEAAQAVYKAGVAAVMARRNPPRFAVFAGEFEREPAGGMRDYREGFKDQGEAIGFARGWCVGGFGHWAHVYDRREGVEVWASDKAGDLER